MSSLKAREYFQIFFEAAQSILSSPALEPTLEALVQRTVAALGTKAGLLRLVDPKTNRLELVAAHGLSRTYLEKGALDADRSIPEVLQGKPVCVKDAFNDPRLQYREALRSEGLNTILSVPVIAKEKVIGVLRLYTTAPRDFSAEEIEFASALAQMGGLAIANARIYETEGVKLSALLKKIGVELPPPAAPAEKAEPPFPFEPVSSEKSLGYFRTLNEATQAILSTLDSQEVMELIVAKIIDLLDVKGCALRLINETTRELELLACQGLSSCFLQKGPPHTDRSIRETLQGTPVLVADTTTDPRLEYPRETLAEGIASILSLPIMAHQRVLGVLRIYSTQQRRYNQDEVTFLSALAQIVGIAIMNARLYEKTTYDLSFWTASLEYLREKPE